MCSETGTDVCSNFLTPFSQSLDQRVGHGCVAVWWVSAAGLGLWPGPGQGTHCRPRPQGLQGQGFWERMSCRPALLPAVAGRPQQQAPPRSPGPSTAPASPTHRGRDRAKGACHPSNQGPRGSVKPLEDPALGSGLAPVSSLGGLSSCGHVPGPGIVPPPVRPHPMWLCTS